METSRLRGCEELPRRRAIITLAVILAAGFVLRLATAIWSFCSTFDTATVGLMAVNILTKGERPLFFYGQNYFGSIEAFFAALLFKLSGVSEVSLSMAPILFSLGWMVASYLLFSEWLGRRAGLIAAGVVAFPDFVIMRYCVGTDGGYPTAFMFGTLALWLALRIEGRDQKGGPLVAPAILLGAIAGLSIWTHAITVAYLLPGASLVLIHVIRNRFAWRVIGPFLLGLVPLVICLVPLFSVMSFSGDGKDGLSIVMSPEVLWSNFAGMFARPLRQHLVSQWEADWTKYALRFLLLATFVLYLIRGREFKWPAERWRYAFPFVFAAIFTVLYIINPQAAMKAARYTIPLWAILLAGLLAGPLTSTNKVVRRAGLYAMVVWSLFYIFSNVHYIFDTAGRRRNQMAEREGVVEAAREAGLKSVKIVAPSLIGHEGQIYSFTSHGTIAFVNAYDERHQPSAALFENDDRGGFLIQRNASGLFAQSLREMGASSAVRDVPGQTLFYDVRSAPLWGRFIPAVEITSITAEDREVDDVSDRCLETARSGVYGDGQSILLRVNRAVSIDAMVMVPPRETNNHRVPRKYHLEGSLDGLNFFTIRKPVERVALAYTAGNRVWAHGYAPYSESRFAPVEVQFLRITPLANSRADDRWWKISEIYLHETSSKSEPVQHDEIDRMVDYVRSHGVSFVMADRWLSAKLIERLGDGYAFPRYNPKFRNTKVSREIKPAPGLALALARPFVDDALSLLRDTFPNDEYWVTTNFGYYTLITFLKDAPVTATSAIKWYGSSIVIQSNNPSRVATHN